jgi:hypothetical protein
MGDMTRVLGEVDRIARRGRNFGFRLISITQRPAKLNKDVLTQLSTLIALDVTNPQDCELWADVEREKRWFATKWARQEKEIRKIIDSTQGMYGDLQAVTGRSLAAIPALEAPSDTNDGDGTLLPDTSMPLRPAAGRNGNTSADEHAIF